MGHRGKVRERERARQLRARSWTLQEIADELGVAKASVSVWVRDVDFVPRPRNRGNRVTRPHPAHLRKLAEIDEMNRWATARIGLLTDRDLLVAGAMLYVGEGHKTCNDVGLANTDPDVIRFFVTWIRELFDVDERRWRGRLYLHEGLDLDGAERFWSQITGIPVEQFHQPYRPTPRDGIRTRKHEHGCFTATYRSARMHRAVMGLCRALLSSGGPIPG